MKTKFLFNTIWILLTCLVICSIAAEKPFRIRPIIHINNELFEGDIPKEVLCLFIRSTIGNDYANQVFVYHVRNYAVSVGPYTTYYARDPFWSQWYPDGVKPHLGEYLYGRTWGYPDCDVPWLIYGGTPPIHTVYHVVVHNEPRYVPYVPTPPPDYLGIIHEEDPIAWAKTVNAIGEPVNWWYWSEHEGFYFHSQLPGYAVPNFNNFPHPQGHTFEPGWPIYWPGDPGDHCHWDWCPLDQWPDELPEEEPYAHDWMTLEMVIDDWGTWEELWEEDIWEQGRWVQ